MTNWWQHVNEIKQALEDAHINYCFIDKTALVIHELEIAIPDSIEVTIQWDQFEIAYTLFHSHLTSKLIKTPQKGYFTVDLNGTKAQFSCMYNHVVITDKHRVPVVKDGETFYIKSLNSFLHSPYREIVVDHLEKQQHIVNMHNKQAWTVNAYTAWVTRFGEPHAIAKKIADNPEGYLSQLFPYFSDITGKKIINLLGSNGLKAIALTLLGAEATVVDISEENARYANDVANSANSPLHYIVSDVLELPTQQLSGQFDYVLMEKGILHYFLNLSPLLTIVYDLLKPGGQLILEDFHPISTKLIKSTGKKHKVTGNYFDSSIKQVPVAYGKHLNNDIADSFVYEKYWTLGEIITAVARSNLFITALEENPNIKKSDAGIPKTFTLLAKKPYTS